MSVSPTGPAAPNAATPPNPRACAQAATASHPSPAGGTPHAPVRPFGHVLASAMGVNLSVPPKHAAPGRASVPAAATDARTPVHARVDPKADREKEGDEPKHGERSAHAHPDPLDPSLRNPALVAPPGIQPMTSPVATEAAEAPRTRMSLEELLPALVRRIAWTGDRNKGTVRLEIGAGAYAGTTLVVHADAGRVRVEVSGPDGHDRSELCSRLDARLRRHGLDVESVG